MSSEDFFWGSVTGASMERATNHLVQARESRQRMRRHDQETARRIAREKSLQESFRAGIAKMDELRELLHEARTERDHHQANKEQFRLGYRLVKEEFKKIHPDAENIIAEIDRRRFDLYDKILTDKGYTDPD